MHTRLTALGLTMALAMLPSISGISGIGSIHASQHGGAVWGTPQDTSQAGQMAPRGMQMGPHMRMHGRMVPGMMMRHLEMHGMGMQGMCMGPGMPGMMDPEHVGPGVLLALRGELGLTDDQVSRLEKIREDHHALMEGMRKNMQDLHESMVEARSERDWSALERAIDEMAGLQAGMAKGHLNVERESLQVLNESQRQTLETWEEGARLFRHHRFQGRPHMHAPGMGAGSMYRHHQAAPLPPPSN
jgi:hypothetical protein